jgi:hypothetical protein
MKKFLLLIAVAVLLIPMLATAAEKFPGQECDTYRVPQQGQAGDDVVFNVTPEQVEMIVRIYGAAGANGKLVPIAEGKKVILHSKYLNNTLGEKNDNIAVSSIEKGYAKFTFKNPSATIANNKPFRERFWMSADNSWVAIPAAKNNPYYAVDYKQNPGIEAVFMTNAAYIVPSEWQRDYPDRFGITPYKMYGAERIRKVADTHEQQDYIKK